MAVVLAFILEMAAFTFKSDLQRDNDDILFLELLLHKTKPINIRPVYRIPKQNDFLSNFEEILTNLCSDCETIIFGDFYICCLQRSSSIFKSYLKFSKLLYLDQSIAEPTRIKTTTSSLLDHILCNNE